MVSWKRLLQLALLIRQAGAQLQRSAAQIADASPQNRREPSIVDGEVMVVEFGVGRRLPDDVREIVLESLLEVLRDEPDASGVCVFSVVPLRLHRVYNGSAFRAAERLRVFVELRI
jgi:hypothetical protein